MFSADQPFVGYRIDGHGLLNQPVEQLASMPAGPTIEAERELIQLVVEMLDSHGPLPQQIHFCLIGDEPACGSRADAADATDDDRDPFSLRVQNS